MKPFGALRSFPCRSRAVISASRSARILSRSTAMMRMRWFMRSRASIGMAIVSTVAKAQMPPGS